MSATPPSPHASKRRSLLRQHAHWTAAARRLARLDELADGAAWRELERDAGVALRDSLGRALARLRQRGTDGRDRVLHAPLAEAERTVQSFRRAYLRTETTLDFFADAVATRAQPRTGAVLRGADVLARASMGAVLAPLGHPTPPVLTYIDKGLGASILKAGLRLWDGTTENPVAAIKIVRHNLLQPTALIHEAGHQVAHVVGWNRELAHALAAGIPGELGETFASWASEIAADAYAFVHAGFASVHALQCVVDGGPGSVFRFLPGDPHPISYLRVLLGVAMCRRAFGAGPWDRAGAVWRDRYPVARAPAGLRGLLRHARDRLPAVAEATVWARRDAFLDRSLAERVPPERVAPPALRRLARRGGPELLTSNHWLREESLRILALTGYRLSTGPLRPRASASAEAPEWLGRLGEVRAAI